MGDGGLKLLLDTHTWIWGFEGAEALGPTSRNLLLDAANERWVSAVSTLEIARLVRSERLTLTVPLARWLEQSREDLNLRFLPIDHAVAREAYELPEPLHRDPADRQLLATARLHGCTLLTADQRLLTYPHASTHNARL